MKSKIGIVSRILLLLCAFALVTVLFVPLWKIDLVAPQYPEGLSLLIFPNKLAGNVDIINGLNHYIGMKTLHTKDFTEFTILPYLIIFFAALFFIAAIIGRRRFLNTVFILFVAFGIVAMADFWKWEYDYGHNLNPDAAIQVPGMSYQPPLIGYKQLLNFSAYSLPHTGGWLFVAVGVIALLCVVITWKANKKFKHKQSSVKAMAAGCLLIFFVSSCNTSPEQIKVGTDNCSFCKMTISDERYGAEIVTKKGKAFKFDDAHCILSYLKTMDKKDIAEIYFTAFNAAHELVNVKNALFFKSNELNTPMGGNVAAFSNEESLKEMAQKFNGTKISWDELNK